MANLRADPSPDHTIDELRPEQVHLETIDAFHLGGNRYAASFELSDPHMEFARSYLLDINFSDTLTFTVRQQIDQTIMSHASLAPDRHVVLELGGRMHDLGPGGDSVTVLPNGVLRRLFHLDDGPQYVVGDRGAAYIREGAVWEEIAPYDAAVIRDVHGPNPGAIHACGHSGLLLRLQGRAWVPIDLPDHRNFHALEVSPDGAIHLGGADGTALALVNDELIQLETPPRDIFGIRTFKGRRFWSDANWGISVQEGNSLLPFRELRQAFYMHASAEKLVVSGWKEVFIFDGEHWSGFELGYDGNIFLSQLDMAQYGG